METYIVRIKNTNENSPSFGNNTYYGPYTLEAAAEFSTWQDKHYPDFESYVEYLNHARSAHT